jgi:hypothetical protein
LEGFGGVNSDSHLDASMGNERVEGYTRTCTRKKYRHDHQQAQLIRARVGSQIFPYTTSSRRMGIGCSRPRINRPALQVGQLDQPKRRLTGYRHPTRYTLCILTAPFGLTSTVSLALPSDSSQSRVAFTAAVWSASSSDRGAGLRC